MPGGRDRPPLDVDRPAASSSSSSSSSSLPESSRQARPAHNSGPKLEGLDNDDLAIAIDAAPLNGGESSERCLSPHRQSSTSNHTQLTRDELRKQQEERATKFMESAVSVPVPDPKLYLQQLLEQLECDPSLLSSGSVAALETYALRLNEGGFARRVRGLAARERLPLSPRLKLGRHRHLKVEGNLWMSKKYPPLALLPEDESRITANTFLRHQHHLLIHSQGHSLRNAISTLDALKASPTEKLAALHLALCYAQEPHALLDEAKAAGISFLRRQTAHCSVIALLQQRSGVADVQRLVKRFRQRPSSESFRLVAVHALEHDDEALARYAWEKGRLSLANERRLASGPMDPRSSPSVVPSSERISAMPPVTPRFRHLGRHLTRWERVMHRMKTRGWAHRAQFDPDKVPKDLPTLAARWFWGPDPNPPVAEEVEDMSSWLESSDQDER